LKDEYQGLKTKWGGYAGYDRFFAEPLSNAHLASIATYNDFVPGFRALLKKDGDLPRFYADVRKLAALDKNERHASLKALGATQVSVPGQPAP
jgi:predicted aminopeptidase